MVRGMGILSPKGGNPWKHLGRRGRISSTPPLQMTHARGEAPPLQVQWGVTFTSMGAGGTPVGFPPTPTPNLTGRVRGWGIPILPPKNQPWGTEGGARRRLVDTPTAYSIRQGWGFWALQTPLPTPSQLLFRVW